MDIAPRSAFLASSIPADKRTAIMGALGVVNTSFQSIGPLLAGVLAGNGNLGVSFKLAGCLKIVSDLGILVCFG